MKNHPSRERLGEWLDGCLSEADSQEIEAHLETCAQACPTILEELSKGVRPADLTTSFAEAKVEAPKEMAEPGRFEMDFSRLFAPPQQPDEIGRLGGYRILRVLGHGGMGVVFLAEDTILKRRVALKAIKPSLGASSEGRERFLREAQMMACVEHPNVVTIHHAGEQDNVAFLAMEYLTGESLEARLQREGPLPISETLRIGREIAEGLAAAHARGLIHRDIKPANLWLEKGRNQTKVLDFGLARAAVVDVKLTQSGMVIGTPAYMAPEQAAGKKVDERCDLFSLGVVLYRMTTGVLPFDGQDIMQILHAIAVSQPKAPRLVNPKIPEELSELIMKLLAKEPKERHEAADQVVACLRHLETVMPAELVAAGPGKAGTVTFKSESTKETQRVPIVPRRSVKELLSRKRWIAIGAGVAAALLLGTFYASGVILRASASEGTIVVKNMPADAEAFVDGEPVTVKIGGEDSEIRAKPGTRKLEIRSGGKVIRSEDVTIEVGGRPVAITLEAPVEVVQFIVSTDAKGQFISLGDAVREAPEGARLLLRPGRYKENVVIRKPLEIVAAAASGEVIIESDDGTALILHAD